MSRGHPGQHRPSFPTAIRQRCPAQTRHSRARAPGYTASRTKHLGSLGPIAQHLQALVYEAGQSRMQCSVDSTDRKSQRRAEFRVEVLLLPTSRLPPPPAPQDSPSGLALALLLQSLPWIRAHPWALGSASGSRLVLRRLGSLCNFPGFVPGSLGNTCL